MTKNVEKKRETRGQPKKYNELTFVYGGVRLPMSWKGTDKMKEYKRRMNEIIQEMVQGVHRKEFLGSPPVEKNQTYENRRIVLSFNLWTSRECCDNKRDFD